MEIKQVSLIKEIPQFPNFYATTDGKILNNLKEPLKTFPRDSYNWVFIKGTEYKVATLILSTFVPIPDYITNSAMANHFNLDKTDDRLENLDWVDRKWNAVHRYLMGVEELSLDSYIYFKSKIGEGKTGSLEVAAGSVGVTPKEAWEAIKSGKEINGWTLQYISRVNKTESGKIANKSVARDPSEYGERYGCEARAVKIMDVITNEIAEYRTIIEAARAHEVRSTHIRNRISTPEKPKMFNKRFIIIDANKDFNWATPTVIKMLLERGDKKVVVLDAKKKEFSVHNSARSWIMEYSGFPKKRATIAAQLKRKGHCKFMHFYITYLPAEREHDASLFLIEYMIGLHRNK